VLEYYPLRGVKLIVQASASIEKPFLTAHRQFRELLAACLRFLEQGE
jgi:hypothetical protein